jgi:MFS family permease
MSLPTFLMGLAPTYAQAGVIAPLFLLIVRILQGAAVGGEVPGAWVFVSEHVPRRRIGFACGTLVAGLAIGILLGSVISAIVNRSYGTQEVVTYMWRLPFLIGGLFGLFSMFLRRWLRETPVFVELRQRKSLAAEIPLRAVLRAHRRAVVVSMALTSMLAAQIGVVILTTPQLLQRHFHFTAESTLTANCAASLASAFGCIASGLIADRFGARRTIVIGSLALVACYYSMFREVGGQPALLVSLYTLSGLAVGVVAVVPLVMVKMFPPVVRFSGVSFSYNVAYALLGGLTPVVVSLMTKSQPYAPVFYVTAFCILGVTSLPFIKESPLIVVSP